MTTCLLLVGFTGAAAPLPSPVHTPPSGSLLVGDYPPPPADERGFDVLSYDLDIHLDPSSLFIRGQVDMGWAPTAPGLTTVQLDLVEELTCTAVRDGDQDLVFSREGDAILVHLATPPVPGVPDTLTTFWEGRPPRHGQLQVGLLFRQHNAGTPTDPADDVPIIANISEPWSAHAWWPCKDHPADKALVSLAVTVPDTLSAVSNGRLLEVTHPAPGWRRFAWREEYPLPTYLVSVAASNYSTWTEMCGDVPLEYHVFPSDRAHAEIDFAPTCAMLEFLADRFGPYPFAGEKYAQVEIKWVGAMEHATATSVSQMFLTGDRQHELLVVHELAHHWFGNSLSPAQWSDIWLNEGFARYSEALWVEQTQGPAAYRKFMASIGREGHPDLFQEMGLLGDPDPILPNILIYDKGAWLLHSLRLLLGDQAFDALLYSYVTDPALVHSNVGTRDFIARAEDQAGRSLDGFFTPWLETSEVPQLWTRTSISQNQATLRVVQNQDTLFEVALPVALRTTTGLRKETVLVSRRDQTFTWEMEEWVQEITVDPDTLVFMTAGRAPVPPLQAHGPWPNPVAEAADFRIYSREAGQLKARLFDARGHELAAFDLGPIQSTGPQEDPEATPLSWTWQPAQVTPRPAAGIYWMEFRSGKHRTVRKMALVR
nr:M1 family metallopeptidase [Candidatus Krumholzibacteria bacterium]